MVLFENASQGLPGNIFTFVPETIAKLFTAMLGQSSRRKEWITHICTDLLLVAIAIYIYYEIIYKKELYGGLFLTVTYVICS